MSSTHTQIKSQEELKQHLVEKMSKMRDLRFSLSVSGLKQVRSLRLLKKEIAQLQTLISSSRKVA